MRPRAAQAGGDARRDSTDVVWTLGGLRAIVGDVADERVPAGYQRTPDGWWVHCDGRRIGPLRRRRLERRFRRLAGPATGGSRGFDGGGDPSGDREPRNPKPVLPSAAATLDIPVD